MRSACTSSHSQEAHPPSSCGLTFLTHLDRGNDHQQQQHPCAFDGAPAYPPPPLPPAAAVSSPPWSPPEAAAGHSPEHTSPQSPMLFNSAALPPQYPYRRVDSMGRSSPGGWSPEPPSSYLRAQAQHASSRQLSQPGSPARRLGGGGAGRTADAETHSARSSRHRHSHSLDDLVDAPAAAAAAPASQTAAPTKTQPTLSSMASRPHGFRPYHSSSSLRAARGGHVSAGGTPTGNSTAGSVFAGDSRLDSLIFSEDVCSDYVGASPSRPTLDTVTSGSVLGGGGTSGFVSAFTTHSPLPFGSGFTASASPAAGGPAASATGPRSPFQQAAACFALPNASHHHAQQQEQQQLQPAYFSQQLPQHRVAQPQGPQQQLHSQHSQPLFPLAWPWQRQSWLGGASHQGACEPSAALTLSSVQTATFSSYHQPGGHPADPLRAGVSAAEAMSGVAAPLQVPRNMSFSRNSSHSMPELPAYFAQHGATATVPPATSSLLQHSGVPHGALQPSSSSSHAQHGFTAATSPRAPVVESQLHGQQQQQQQQQQPWACAQRDAPVATSWHAHQAATGTAPPAPSHTFLAALQPQNAGGLVPPAGNLSEASSHSFPVWPRGQPAAPPIASSDTTGPSLCLPVTASCYSPRHAGQSSHAAASGESAAPAAARATGSLRGPTAAAPAAAGSSGCSGDGSILYDDLDEDVLGKFGSPCFGMEDICYPLAPLATAANADKAAVPPPTAVCPSSSGTTYASPHNAGVNSLSANSERNDGSSGRSSGDWRQGGGRSVSVDMEDDQTEVLQHEQDVADAAAAASATPVAARPPVRFCVNCTEELEAGQEACAECGQQHAMASAAHMATLDLPLPSVQNVSCTFGKAAAAAAVPSATAAVSDPRYPVSHATPSEHSPAVEAGGRRAGVGQSSGTLLAYDERMLLHRAPEPRAGCSSHPERPDRVLAVMTRLQATGLLALCQQVHGREASVEELAAVHDTALILEVEEASRKAAKRLAAATSREEQRRSTAAASGDRDYCDGPDSTGGTESDDVLGLLDFLDDSVSSRISDCYVNAATYSCARLAAGGAVDVAVAVAQGRARNGAAIIRPPGHHAESGVAMGFCYFNNAAVAVRAAQKAGARKVLVMDWDVHHGNGTQHIFEDDDTVMYASIHRHDHGFFFPGTGSAIESGRGLGVGYTVNVPWDGPGAGDGDYVAAFQHVILPIAREFAPDLVIVSAGFDAVEGDPLGACRVTPHMFGHMTAWLGALAPIVLLLEGGYNLAATAACTEHCVRVLLGAAPQAPPPPPSGARDGEGTSGGEAAALPAPTALGLTGVRKALREQMKHWSSAAAQWSAVDPARPPAAAAPAAAAPPRMQGMFGHPAGDARQRDSDGPMHLG